ncbi:MAG: hypothetical protein KBA28_04925 [Syntrophaceae bacterium]|jgi:hypothetical protein|nr:hypothetical protein [Syntrophaceae bacterium]HOC59983.1 hypothetical protein [Smithellaceae bacterium]
MLKVIDEKKQIARYARRFAKSFRPFLDEEIKVHLGHQGASVSARVSWLKSLGIWTFTRTAKDGRFWNAFGVGKPKHSGYLPITTEINFPEAGIDRKTGAAFAADAWNRVYVVHRGKIGGGKKGVGKSFFEDNYRGVWAWMEDGGSITKVAVIGELRSSRFALQIAQFVEKIDKLKSSDSLSSQTSLHFSEISFSEEQVGETFSASLHREAYDCDHDLIISHLAGFLSRKKWKVGNDASTELFSMQRNSDRASHIFAVSSGKSEQSVLAAAAKLLLQKAALPDSPYTILILPEDIAEKYVSGMQLVGIDVAVCRLDGEKIIFPDPGKMKLDQNPQL